jgi:hypothetical protein
VPGFSVVTTRAIRELTLGARPALEDFGYPSGAVETGSGPPARSPTDGQAADAALEEGVDY